MSRVATMPTRDDLAEKERNDSAWYSGVDLQWRTPPPMIPVSSGRKRPWEEVVTPVEEESTIQDMQVRQTNVAPRFEVTPPLSHGIGGGISTETEDDVEEIPRTRMKMQTGCIPCLYVFMARSTR
jgi:hypothetical protein